MATEQPGDTSIFMCHRRSASANQRSISQKDESWEELLPWFVAIMADYRAALFSPQS